jgi:hypothetical protein
VLEEFLSIQLKKNAGAEKTLEGLFALGSSGDQLLLS